MATIEMTKDNFEETISTHDVVLIDFWASWCGPCKMFGPIFEKASESHQDVAFAKVNTEAEQELAASFGVRSIPMVVAFREKVPVFGQPGMLPEQAIDELITQIKALDMDEVRAEYERQKAEFGG